MTKAKRSSPVRDPRGLTRRAKILSTSDAFVPEENKP